MNENIRQAVKPWIEWWVGPMDANERAMAELMYAHWSRVEEVLAEEDSVLNKPRWALAHKEVMVGNEKVLVVGGLMPPVDKEGKAIPEMRAEPVLFCIPKNKLTAEEAQFFDQSSEDGEEREQIVQRIVRSKDNFLWYCFPGWGAPPATFVLPMSRIVKEQGGVGVIAGLMGSMGTTAQDKSPKKFAREAKYSWQEIKDQALGLIYQVEGSEALEGSVDDLTDDLRRAIIGHSMQGFTTLRELADYLDFLPGTYFIPITPLLEGGKTEHVILGKGIRGLLMALDREVLGGFDPDIRETVLSMLVIVVLGIIKSHIAGGNPEGGQLILLAHTLEYLRNPRAVMRASRGIEQAPRAVSDRTIHLIGDKWVDLLLIVCASQDKVLKSENSIGLVTAIAEGLYARAKVSNDGLFVGEKNVSAVINRGDGHYPSSDGWDNILEEFEALIVNKSRVKQGLLGS